ncbi:uncharacterized protein isoform X2 [Musca autumnalis]|uniref:uncharacterized protein isoform X2 n=1 Tax=Musca autumnalis TaxID=221902 RepID=UPI003CED181E
MDNSSNNLLLNDILRAADKHPNSKVSKLIRTVEEEPSQKNIVLLLIELSEHAEYSTDFNISLRYYLDLFERLGIDRDLILNEAGLLLVNSSKIYSKRVDYVQSLVERQILTLSNADQEIQQQKEQNEKESSEEAAAATAEKPKRGRKRALDAPTDPYEVQLEPKKFKKMTEEKRFAPPKTPVKPKSLPRNIEMEQQIHPAGWLHATIYDLENEEEVDTKRNYKLFTYHIEHRYNTLVPDINFRLHFKVKDYLDAQAEEENEDMDSAECQRNQEWPPLSEEYVQKYINLENRVLQLEIDPLWKSPRRSKSVPLNANQTEEDMPATLESSLLDLNGSNVINDVSSINDSGIGTSIMESTANTSQFENNNSTANSHETTLNNSSAEESEANKTADTTHLQENESGLGDSLLIQTESCNDATISDAEKSLNETTNSIVGENEKTLPPEKLTEEGVVTDAATTGNDESEKQTENTNGEPPITQSTNEESTIAMEATERTSNKEQTTEETAIITVPLANGEVTAEDTNNCIETAAGGQQTANEKELEKGSEEKESSTENVAGNQANEASAESETDKPEEVPGDSTKEKEGFIELEVHVMNDNDNEPSERLQIQIPATDDEGVHLSDVYEGDLHMLTPTVKLNNTSKDVTIYMDDELRQALEMRDGVMEHFSQETYKVPVIELPKEHPLLLNIFKLPPKLVRRKVLFKLGPEMDSYLRARSMKPSRPPPNPRQYTLSKSQLQAFSLNNTDMSGIIDTPPNSPGHNSEFCGFTDSESEFFGFTEDEQHKLVVSPHRLSRDSGVGVDASILTPEKEPLETIFEENLPADVNSCKLNLNSALETTEEILSDLPDAIRTALEAEMEIGTAEENNKESADGKEVATADETEERQGVEGEKPTAVDDTEIATADENKELQDGEIEKPTSSGESAEPNKLQLEGESKESPEAESLEKPNEESGTNEGNNADCVNHDVSSPPNDENAENQKESLEINSDPVVTTLNESEGIQVQDENDGCINTPGDESETAVPVLKQNIDCDESQQDSALLDLDLQGTKTKIQQWHEHLRPILAKSRERHHFDVFQLGTEIIDTIQSTNNHTNEPYAISGKPEASFDDIMDNKDRSYVSRYFLSTLLLANQSNVNIKVENKTSERPSAWSDIKLKLLSTKRHTVAIEDNIGMITSSKRKQTAAEEAEESQQLKKKKVKSKKEEDVQESLHDEDDDEPLVKLKTTTPTKRRSKESPSRQHEKKFKGLTLSPAKTTTNTPQAAKHKTQEEASSVETSTPQQPSRPKENLIVSQEILSPITELPTTSSQAALATQHQILVQENRKTYQDHRKSPDWAYA